MRVNSLKHSNNKTVIAASAIVDRILKGIGQIMLQENAITGLLFLIGIFYGSIAMGMATILATLSGQLTARLLRFDSKEIDAGLYGFSPALVGVAMILFHEPVLAVWIAIALGGALAAILQHIFIRNKIPAFTLPFVLVTWGLLFLTNAFFPEWRTAASETLIEGHDFAFVVKGYAQIIFQDSLLAGVLFFIAVFISSPIAALYGLAGGIVTAILALHFSITVTDIEIGLYSFNAILCGIVFAGEKPKDGFWALIAVVLSFGFSYLFFKYGLIQLTFPFVAASFLTVILKKIQSKKSNSLDS